MATQTSSTATYIYCSFVESLSVNQFVMNHNHSLTAVQSVGEPLCLCILFTLCFQLWTQRNKKNGTSAVVFMQQQTNHPFFIIWTWQGWKAAKSVPVQPNPRTLWSCSSNWEVHFFKLLPSHYLYLVHSTKTLFPQPSTFCFSKYLSVCFICLLAR